MTPKKDFDRRAYNGPVTWPDAAIALIKREIPLGISSGQIAKKLYAELGISKTRNAVIGKVIRLGLTRPAIAKASKPGRPKVVRIEPVGRQEVVTPAMVSANPAQPSAFRISLGGAVVKPSPSVPLAHGREPFGPWRHVAFLDLQPSDCRMPVGDGAAFCGCRCERGMRGRFESYCATHKAVVRAKAEKAKPRDADMQVFSVRRFVSQKIGSRYNGF